MPQISPTEAAYIAGLIDSDGSISITRRTRAVSGNAHFRVLMQFGQKQGTVPNWIMEVIGGGAVHEHRKRIFHNLVFNVGTLRWLMPAIYPFMVLKRRQAELAMEFMSISNYQQAGRRLTETDIARREAIRFECEQLNKKNPSSFREVELPKLKVVA